MDETIDPALPTSAATFLRSTPAPTPPDPRSATGRTPRSPPRPYHVGTRIDPEPFDIVIRPSGTVDPDVLAAMQQAATRWGAVVARGLGDVPVHLRRVLRLGQRCVSTGWSTTWWSTCR